MNEIHAKEEESAIGKVTEPEPSATEATEVDACLVAWNQQNSPNSSLERSWEKSPDTEITPYPAETEVETESAVS